MCERKLALLDVGASVGHFLNRARNRGHRTVGIELSQDMVGYLKSQGHRAYCGTLAALRLEGSSFDVVTYLEVFEHLRYPVRELSQVRRVLRKGGILCLEIPNARFQLWKGRVEKCRLYQALFDKPAYGLMPHIHFNHFTADTAEKMLVDNNFEVLETMVREPTTTMTRYPSGLTALLDLWIAFSHLLFVSTNVHLSNAIVLIARKN
jgi:2-polyprenyl-3-methyl-5-hydroxy-6-metoxy-1,4-benzoquinol methylase